MAADQLGVERIEMNIANQFQKTGIFLTDNRRSTLYPL
jgi:hypothetical protein